MEAQVGGVRVVEQAIEVLFAIARGDQVPGVRGFAEGLDMSKTTLQRILASLQSSGLVVYDPAHQIYSLTNRVLTLSTAFQHDQNVVTMLRPHMERLRQLSGETVCLSLTIDHQRVTIFQLDSRRELRFTTQIGRGYPLVVGATGRVLLGGMEPAERQRVLQWYADNGPVHLAHTTVDVDIEMLEERAVQARVAGYAESHAEWAEGGVGVAVPVVSPDGQYAALSLYGVESRLNQLRVKELLPELLRVSQMFSWPGGDGGSR